MAFKARAPRALILGVSLLALSAGAALAQQAPAADDSGSNIETIVVTAQKRAESVQTVPIAVSAFGQDTLDTLNIDGGPNLLLAIPNVTFSKGNFTGSNFAIRGVGSRAVGASADATVGVHQNGAPLTANLLFEAEFFDVERVEVLRGPQGTLYGRNATGGVINMITAKADPGVWDGEAELTLGNYGTIRPRGMVNIPLGDNFALRVAGTATLRDGYGDNLTTGNNVDNRDLYAYRVTLGGDFSDSLRGWISYDRFQEDDNRVRASKQLCATDPGRTSVGGVPVLNNFIQNMTSQGCLAAPLDDPRSLGVLNVAPTLGGLIGNLTGLISGNPAAGLRAPTDVRDIYAAFDPVYRANQELWMGQLEWDITPDLTATYLYSTNTTSVFSSEDYNKLPSGAPFNTTLVSPGGFVNDPQLGLANTLRTFDISAGTSEQTTHELRLQSDFDGRFNFTVGAIKIGFETVADYYVFSNSLTGFAQLQNILAGFPAGALGPGTATGPGVAVPIDPGRGAANLVDNVTDRGRNYFLSRTPYQLDAYAFLGEFYYNISDTTRLTVGVRYTKDDKTQGNLSTLLLVPVGAVPATVTTPFVASVPPVLRSDFDGEFTGKINLDWQPELGFTDDTLLFLTLSRGYKGGGFNPPGAVGVAGIQQTFAPEFINAIELGTKNDIGNLRLNGSIFYYDYTGYQVSKIVNRTSANENIDTRVFGIELETLWAPTDNWTFNANIGYLTTEIQSGRSIDTLDRTQGNPNLTVVKRSDASNCVMPTRGVAQLVQFIQSGQAPATSFLGLCSNAFTGNIPNTNIPWAAALGSPDSDRTASDGVDVNLAGREMPSSPEFTVSLGAQYSWTWGSDWDALARIDYYWQAESFSRVYNTAHDRLPAWNNINATVRFNHADGFYLELYAKNLTDEEVITDAYLTDDSSGLFTNVFYTEPRTFGITLGKAF
jgi:outer membrane receptor protein involved in Fe transport